MTDHSVSPDLLREALSQLDTDAANFEAASKAEEERRDWAMADRWRYMATATREAVRAVRAALQASPAPDPERLAADALLNWYDTTHGNDFGHDHHCPVHREYGNEYAPSQMDDRCTCGWSGFLKANEPRQ